MAEAICHWGPGLDELHGVWVHDERGLDSFYPEGEDSPEHQYGEAVVTNAPWASQLDHLPSVSPYLAAWAVVERSEGESAEAVFRRVLKDTV